MSDSTELLREIDALDALQRLLARIAGRTDDDRRRDLLDLRRQLSLKIARIGDVAEPVFADGDAETCRTYRNKFSAMRSATALHQASFPVVSLDENRDAYAVSARNVDAEIQGFVYWARTALVS